MKIPGIFLLFCIAVTVSVRVTAAPAERAEALIDDLAHRTLVILRNETMSGDDRQAALQDLLREGFALRGIARFVAGRYWHGATGAERRRFVELFAASTVAVWSKRLARYADRNMQVVGSSAVRRNGNRTTHLVHSHILSADGRTIRVDWRVTSDGVQTRVTDIVVAGISMATTQRDEFTTVIRRNGRRLSALTPLLQSRIGDHALASTTGWR